MKRDRYPEEAKYSVGQKSAGLTRLLCERGVIGQSNPRDFEVARIIDTIPGRTDVMPEIDVPLYSEDRASHLLRAEVLLGTSECYSCGNDGSSFCDYCGRCSHCCDKIECQYGCDFV